MFALLHVDWILIEDVLDLRGQILALALAQLVVTIFVVPDELTVFLFDVGAVRLLTVLFHQVVQVLNPRHISQFQQSLPLRLFWVS